MKAKRGKRKAVPAIVPRFLKNAVTIGTIPVLAASCGPSHKQIQPVVAYMGPDERTREPMPAPDAGVDAATVQQRPPPPVVAMMVTPPQPVVAMMVTPPPPPPVVAAMVPRDEPQPPAPPPKTKQKQKQKQKQKDKQTKP